MQFDSGISHSAAFIAIALLLILSIWTIQQCRRDKGKPRTEEVYLFAGKSFLHSITSSAGSFFSLTYFLGAPMIYAKVYGAWLFFIIAIVTIITIFLNLLIINKFENTIFKNRTAFRTSNAMIHFLKERCDKRQFQIFIFCLLTIYMALIVEELSISRLVLSKVLISNNIIAAALLCIIVFVSYSYIYIGGYKAVLNSDKIQTIILLLFMAILIVISLNNPNSQMHLQKENEVNIFSLFISVILWSIMGIAWLVGAVDYYSRMNFVALKPVASIARKQFAIISIISICFVVVSAVLFSNSILHASIISSPDEYYASVVSYFISFDSISIVSIFLVAVFCMIFTTLDTLLLTSLQISFFYRMKPASRGIRSRLSSILVICALFSAIVPNNMVCAGGIFVASLFIVLVCAFFQKLFPILDNLLPNNWLYIPATILISVVIFRVYYQQLENKFEIHYLIPGIVLVVLILTVLIMKLFEVWRSSKGINSER